MGIKIVASVASKMRNYNHKRFSEISNLPATQAVSGTVAVSSSITPKAGTTDGATINYTISAASTNAKNIKASAGQVYSIVASNSGASASVLKLYNKTTSPTVGTDTPVLAVIIPAGGTIDLQLPVGIRFTSGIGLALTKALSTADTVAVGANEVAVSVHYA